MKPTLARKSRYIMGPHTHAILAYLAKCRSPKTANELARKTRITKYMVRTRLTHLNGKGLLDRKVVKGSLEPLWSLNAKGRAFIKTLGEAPTAEIIDPGRLKPAEWERRHAAHVELQRRCGIPEDLIAQRFMAAQLTTHSISRNNEEEAA